MAPRGKWASGPPSLSGKRAGRGSSKDESSPPLASSGGISGSSSAAPTPKLGGAWAARRASAPDTYARAGPTPKSSPSRQVPRRSALTRHDDCQSVGSVAADGAVEDKLLHEEIASEFKVAGAAADGASEDKVLQEEIAKEISAHANSADGAETDLALCERTDKVVSAEVPAKTCSASGSSIAGSSHSSGHRQRRRHRHKEQETSEAKVWRPKLNSNTTVGADSDVDIDKTLQEFADLEIAIAASAASMEPEALATSLRTVPEKTWCDISAWLRELKLQDFAGDVLVWCEENGVCCLDEVVESTQDGEFVEFLGSRGAEVSLLEAKACAAQEHVQARSAAPKPKAEEAPGLPAAQSSSIAGSTPGPWSSTLSSSKSALLSPKSSILSETMWPNIRCGSEKQGKKKKERRISAGDFTPKNGRDKMHSQEDAGTARKAAIEKLEQQLRKEEEQKLAASLAQLTASLEGPCPEGLRRAISDSEQLERAISSHDLRQTISCSLSDAREKLKLKERRHQQRCEEAFFALQHAVEAPRDDKFGEVVRDALLGSNDAIKADGGPEALEDAKAALCLWEELQIALHLALKRGHLEALDLAVEEARKANIPPQHSLLAEAQRALSTAS